MPPGLRGSTAATRESTWTVEKSSTFATKADPRTRATRMAAYPTSAPDERRALRRDRRKPVLSTKQQVYRVSIGDIFTVPLGDGRAALGQVIGKYKSSFYVVVFDLVVPEDVVTEKARRAEIRR